MSLPEDAPRDMSIVHPALPSWMDVLLCVSASWMNFRYTCFASARRSIPRDGSNASTFPYPSNRSCDVAEEEHTFNRARVWTNAQV